MEVNYPFEIEEINPVYMTAAEARERIEKLMAELLSVLDDV